MELLELVLKDNNLSQAIERVVHNEGAGGVDKMNVYEGKEYFLNHKEEIKK